jgi:hypothetical protein
VINKKFCKKPSLVQSILVQYISFVMLRLQFIPRPSFRYQDENIVFPRRYYGPSVIGNSIDWSDYVRGTNCGLSTAKELGDTQVPCLFSQPQNTTLLLIHIIMHQKPTLTSASPQPKPADLSKAPQFQGHSNPCSRHQ